MTSVRALSQRKGTGKRCLIMRKNLLGNRLSANGHQQMFGLDHVTDIVGGRKAFAKQNLAIARLGAVKSQGGISLPDVKDNPRKHGQEEVQKACGVILPLIS